MVGTEQVDHLVVSLDEDLVKQSRLQTKIWVVVLDFLPEDLKLESADSLGKIGSKLKIPVIGSIISVVMSLMNGDPVQKALFKGIGTAVGGIIGGAITGLGTSLLLV